MPAQATLVMGAQGGGSDANAKVYGFTSSLPPDEAQRAYTAELRAAGYLPMGEAGGWLLFRNSAGVVLAVSFGLSGPPTGIVVRVLPPGSPTTSASPVEPSGAFESVAVPRPDPPHGRPSWVPTPGIGNGNAAGHGSGNANGNGNGNAAGHGSGIGNGNGNGLGNGLGNGGGLGRSHAPGTPAANAGGNGRGLGLNVARRLLRAMDGRIWYEDAPAGGAIFASTIPAELAVEPT